MTAITDPRIDLRQLATTELLAMYGGLLDVLNERKVVRSRNAPAGDLAETLAAAVYRGRLAPASAKSWDVETGDRRIQVKALVRATQSRRGGNFSVFRTTTGFDSAVFVVFAPDYTIRSAIEVPAAYVANNATEVAWVNGRRIGSGADLLLAPGARDLTDDFAAALAALDAQ